MTGNRRDTGTKVKSLFVTDGNDCQGISCLARNSSAAALFVAAAERAGVALQNTYLQLKGPLMTFLTAQASSRLTEPLS